VFSTPLSISRYRRSFLSWLTTAREGRRCFDGPSPISSIDAGLPVLVRAAMNTLVRKRMACLVDCWNIFKSVMQEKESEMLS
jgi:hypothetical protein